MKILILGSFNQGALEHYYLDGLRALNITFTAFDISADYFELLDRNLFNKFINKVEPSFLCRRLNERLLLFLANKKFDVILIFKGMFLFPSTIENVKKYCRLLVCYNADHPYKIFAEGSGNKNIINSIRYFDLYLTYSTNICTGLREQFGVKAEVLPFGYDDSKGEHKLYPGVNDYFLFVGAFDQERASQLNYLWPNNLRIFGNDKWQTRTSRFRYLRSMFAGKGLYNEDYSNAMASSLGVLNFLRTQNLVEDSHNMRTFEVPGYGGLLIANRTREQELFFEDKKEAFYFNSLEELSELLLFLNRNRNIVERVKEAGKRRSLNSGYSYRERTKQLIKYLDQYMV